MRRLLAAIVLLAAERAEAQSTDEPTAADVSAAPVPGNESGRLDEDVGESTARVVARGALFVPRTALWLAFKPVEGAAYAYERYQLGRLAREWFWNDAGTAGLFPTVSVQSGFGLDVGLKLVHLDLFGERENVALSTSGGGEYSMNNKLRLRSGERFDHVEVAVDARFQKKPNDAFYGVGNDAADEGRFRDRIMRVAASADIGLTDTVHLTPSAAYAEHEYSPSTRDSPIADPGMLTGFGGTEYGYGELELRYDTRHAADAREARSVISAGTLLAAYGGYSAALDSTNASYGQYGLDAQQFLRLGEGPRVLALRAQADAVTGALAEVPFARLPSIGGKHSMRGYATDRFRDRIAMLGSAEYSWDIARAASAQVFVDAGRVYRDWQDAATSNIDDMHVGYGVGLELHTDTSFLGRLSVASSIDGGVFVDFSLDPVFDLDRRVDAK